MLLVLYSYCKSHMASDNSILPLKILTTSYYSMTFDSNIKKHTTDFYTILQKQTVHFTRLVRRTPKIFPNQILQEYYKHGINSRPYHCITLFYNKLWTSSFKKSHSLKKFTNCCKRQSLWETRPFGPANILLEKKITSK